MIAPCFGRLVRLFQDQMISALPCQVIADRKSDLPSTNDDNIYMSAHENLPLVVDTGAQI